MMSSINSVNCFSVLLTTGYCLLCFEQHDCLRCDGAAFADGVKPFARLRLDAHAIDVDVERLCEVLAHRSDVRPQPGFFKHHGGVNVDDTEPPLAREPHDARQQLEAIGIPPARITVG